MTNKKWRIFEPKHRTYYAGPSSIGPMFGATREKAATFDSALEAVRAMGHWAFIGCRLELPNGKLQSEVPNAGKES